MVSSSSLRRAVLHSASSVLNRDKTNDKTTTVIACRVGTLYKLHEHLSLERRTESEESGYRNLTLEIGDISIQACCSEQCGCSPELESIPVEFDARGLRTTTAVCCGRQDRRSNLYHLCTRVPDHSSSRSLSSMLELDLITLPVDLCTRGSDLIDDSSNRFLYSTLRSVPRTRVRTATGSTPVNDTEANFIVLPIRDSHLVCAEGRPEKPERIGQRACDTISVPAANTPLLPWNRVTQRRFTALSGVQDELACDFHQNRGKWRDISTSNNC